jgi:hypothetical protein
MAFPLTPRTAASAINDLKVFIIASIKQKHF